MSQRVLRSSTETLFSYPPVLAQATGTPTARIGTPAIPVPDAGSNATVDSLSTDVSGDAAAGDTEIAVTSATWVRGRKYLATSTTGDVFPIVSASDGASDTLYLAEPLPTQLLTGSTIVGYRISIALTADQTAEIGETCIVEWTATLGGTVEKWMDDFAIVDRVGSYTLDSPTLLQSSPLSRRLQSDGDNDFSETIDAAWRRYLEPALLAKGIRPHLFVSRKELEPAHIAACEYFLVQQSIDPGTNSLREEAKRDLNEALSLVLNSDSLWIDTSAQDLTPPDPDAPRPWNFVEARR